MSIQKLKIGLTGLIICALSAVIWSEFYMSRRNILAFKKDWHLAQEGFINPGLHVIPNLIYRKLLIGYRLSSDKFMGSVRILSRKEHRPDESKLWFRIGNDSYVDIVFNATNAHFTGIRLSSSDLFPSGIFHSEDNGKYTSFQPLNLLLDSGFKTAVIKNDRLTIGNKDYPLPPGILFTGKVGIQIPTMETEVFAFEVKTKNGEKTLLHFFPEGERWSLYGRHFLIIVFLVMLTGFIPRSRKEISALILAGAGCVLFISSFVVRPQDESIDSTLSAFEYYDSWWKPSDQPSLNDRIEMIRNQKYFPGIFYCAASGCRMLEEKELPPSKTGKRIILFGGSQIRHSLVRKLDDSFHFRFHRALQQKIPDIETININATGQFKDRLVFEKDMERMEIDEIIIETLAFSHEIDLIRSFIERWKQKGVSITLLRTPQNIENFGENLAPIFIPKIQQGLNAEISTEWDPTLAHVLRNVPLIKKMQSETHFLFLDPNDVFLQEKTLHSGQLYWDGFHLTEWGQEIIANWLAEEWLNHRLK